MFALGAASGIFSGAKGKVFSRRVMQIGAILIAAMGLTMFTNGWNLTGIGNPFNSPLVMRNGTIPSIHDDVQIINSTLLPNRYPAITVQQGIPVRWTINAPRGSINGCNNRFIIREYGIEHTFKYGDNVIEFIPLKTGRFPYSCWMGMIRSSITVTAEGDISEQDITPKPAGVKIPTDGIAVAQIMGNYQSVKINLTDNGFEPAIVVMQNRLPALWNISISSNLSANTQLIFPAYYTILFMEQGDNTLQIMPIDDFDFSTGDNLFYGYVKVADDINNVDIDAVKAQAANFVTLIYPPAYFEDDR
jgi:plastocyanin domain-containing protein